MTIKMLCPRVKRFTIDSDGILRESFFTNMEVFSGHKDDWELEQKLLCNTLNNIWGWYEGEYARKIEGDGWISVDDRLPEKGESVLVYIVGSDGVRGPWVVTFKGTTHLDVGVHFTYWKPLPAPPR